MTNFRIANMATNPLQPGRLATILCRWVLAMLFLSTACATAAEQKTFATPEAAVAALTEALATDSDAGIIELFGEKHRSLVSSADKAENSATRSRIHAALKSYLLVEEKGPDTRVLVIGNQAWPMPIPLVRENGVWRYASELGEEELINRRIGNNERNAIVTLHAYVEAQKQYASRDRNDDGVLEYAKKIRSSPGKRDGLYWEEGLDNDGEASPFGPLVAESEAYLKGHKPGDPFRGYFFRILTRQGEHAPGGAHSYIINGRMIAGHALVAFPADYGASGVMTFIVSKNGQIYEKNLGPNAVLIKEFNPGASWKKLEAKF